jgi:hypothetical protein
MKRVNKTIPVAALLLLSAGAFAQDTSKKFEVYGFAQLDYIQDFNRVDPNWAATLRSSKIPTTDGKFGDDGQAILSARQSRLGVNSNLPVHGDNLKIKFEFDMFGVGKDEGQTTIRLRHAYGEWGNILAGQTNTLFMDGDAFPNTIDYWGPSGMVFYRTPQIRYNLMKGDNSAAVALEIPGNSVDPGKIRQLSDELGATIQGAERLPDLTVMGRVNRGWGHLQASGILRSVGFETVGTANNNPQDEVLGWGLNLSSNFKMMEKDKLILAAVYGEGIENYMNDAGPDLAAGGTLTNPSAEAVPLLGLNLYYDHYWNDQYSSSIGYSMTDLDNQSLQNADALNRIQYASVNLLHTPHKNIMYGAELLWGTREDKGGADGSDVRTQVSLKYSFSSLD